MKRLLDPQINIGQIIGLADKAQFIGIDEKSSRLHIRGGKKLVIRLVKL